MRLTRAAATILLIAGCGSHSDRHKLVMVEASSGDVAELVRHEQLAAAPARVLVYVGATWCEPCRRFHAAAEAGQLDGELSGVRFLTFDLDRDRERLAQAGYRPDYIPLFALPAADGRASARSVQGSIKGDGAVGNIVPRLRGLLSEQAK